MTTSRSDVFFTGRKRLRGTLIPAGGDKLRVIRNSKGVGMAVRGWVFTGSEHHKTQGVYTLPFQTDLKPFKTWTCCIRPH